MVETMVKHRLFEEYVIKGRFLYQQKLDTVYNKNGIVLK